MLHPSLPAFLKSQGPLKGPVALILSEDDVELSGTLSHHLGLGFRTVIALIPADAAPPDLPAVHFARHDVLTEDALTEAANAVIAAAPRQWVYAGYNAEYLYYPFAETRSVGEMLAFHAEERRDAMAATVVDLYAADLTDHPDAVDRGSAHIDRAGYYALARKDAAAGWAPLDRQFDLYGGLRWRFEEHVPWERRRIDRIALFRALPNVSMRPDFTLSVPEMNTISCPWHHNLTAAVLSFRAAKALRSNPESRAAIPSFLWRNSVPFQWSSQQLLELGFIEPGQWF
jgi:hypothetical protein